MAPGEKNKFGASVVEPAPPWSKFGAPMSKSEFFRRQIYCIEESTYDIVGTFRHLQQSFDAPAVIQRPHRKLAPRELCPPCPPRCAPELASLLCDVSVSSSKQPIWKLDDLHSTFSFSNCCCEQK